MPKSIAGTIRRCGRRYRLVGTALILSLVALMVAQLPANSLVAKAGGVERFSATAVVFAVSPGTREALPNPPSGMRGVTTGETLAGYVVSSSWGAISPGANLFVQHTSTTVATPSGQVHGRASGIFTVDGFVGEYGAEISAQMDNSGNVISVEDRGTWTASDGNGNFAKGTFRIQLSPGVIPGTTIPSLVGTLTLNGIHN